MFEILLSVVIFAAVFSFLVVMHELGHYFTARFFGVGVSEFAVGFGNLVYSYKDSANTQWSLRALPFGGYVAILDNEHPEVKGKTIDQASYWQKLIIFMGGPLANILTAFVLSTGLFYFMGYQSTPGTVIGQSKISSIQANDKIVSIDGVDVKNWKEVQINLLNKASALIQIEKAPNQREVILAKAEEIIEPKKFNLISKIFKAIGEILGYKVATEKTVYKWDFEPVKTAKISQSFFAALSTALMITIAGISEFFVLLHFIATQGLGILSGPIGIAKSLSSAASMGIEALLLITIKLSMSLGLFNLLPLPMLDGGQVVLATLAKIKGKALSNRFMHIWGYSGLVLIGTLMIYISVMDIFR